VTIWSMFMDGLLIRLHIQVVCRDLWALHLTLLPSPPPAEPYFHAQEVGGAKQGSSATRKSQGDVNTPRESGDEEDKDGGNGSSSSDNESREEEEDQELAALLRENSESSSSSDSEDGEGEITKGNVRKHKPPGKRKKKQSGTQEVLASTVAVLMLACWTMRIPVIYMDFVRSADVCVLSWML
jgi:RNA polymerase I-specific transcription initiation factor RRN7